ncbi:hypothetical protein Hanom_Chr17g01575741 [Helianthus anomalus]
MIEFLQLYDSYGFSLSFEKLDLICFWNCRLLLLIRMKQKLVTSYQPHLLVKCCRYADTFHAHFFIKIMFNFSELLL